MKLLQRHLQMILLLIFTAAFSSLTSAQHALPKLTLSQLAAHHQSLASVQLSFNEAKQALWEKVLQESQQLTELKSEYDHRELKFNDKIMRFSLAVQGEEPKDGYPLFIAFHGGGSAPKALNDSQWEDMKNYYRNSVDNGIYVATRGITDNWKLHFEDESYPLYDKLIESAILFNHVNPDRVYVLGFSAGGDGVYQVAPRMAARFAAANMSAGHHNWITFDNLYNIPFLIQVGENDGAYKRNIVAAENNVALNNLQIKYKGGYVHDAYIHYNGWHNTWRDNDSGRHLQTIIADPVAWLNGDRATKSVNANAIDWMAQFTRHPAPLKLVWDLSVGAQSRDYQTGHMLADVKLAKPAQLFYWLDVSQAVQDTAKGKLVVELHQPKNMIEIVEADGLDSFRILLNPHMLDLDKPIQIAVGNQPVESVSVAQSLDIMTRTLLERMDINQVYSAQITLQYDKEEKQWHVIK